MAQVFADIRGEQSLLQALGLVPLRLRVEAKREMAGRDGLGVDYKRAIAKTGRPSRGSKRGFEKWLYSLRNKEAANQLSHDVRDPGELDDLTLAVGTRPAAAIAEKGGEITAGGSDKLLIPLGATQTKRRNARRLVSVSNDAFVVQQRGPNGRTFLAVRDQKLRTTTRKREGGGRDRFFFAGEDQDGLNILAELVERARRKPGRLDFFGAVARMAAKTDKRMQRAADRALESLDG